MKFYGRESKFSHNGGVIATNSRSRDFAVTDSLEEVVPAYEIVQHMCCSILIKRPIRDIVMVLKIR